MKMAKMVIIIMFLTLQCLIPWEFAVRLSQQRCARSDPLLCSVLVVLCFLVLLPNLCSVVLYCALCFLVLPSTLGGCALGVVPKKIQYY